MNDKFRNIPIYEGLSGDYKFPAVLDIGSAYTKQVVKQFYCLQKHQRVILNRIGISGECNPRAIIRSEIQCKKSHIHRFISDYKDADDLYDMFVEFIHIIYFKYLLLNPKDKHVVIVESPLASIVWRETLARVLYKHYEVASLLIIPAHVFALASLAVDTGLVIDVGYNEITVLPVYSNYPVIHAWQTLPIGTKAVQNNIKTMLARDNLASTINLLSNKVLEDIYVRCCFVTTKSRSDQLQRHTLDLVPGVKYPLNTTTCRESIVVSGRVRELAHEVQHDEDGDHQCLATMVLDAVMCTTVDMRLELLRNIVVIGGGAMAMGFKSRLKEELTHQIATAHSYEVLRNAQFKFHTIPGRDNYAAWLGGAICGCTDMVGMKALTREQFLKMNRLPDWIDLRDNCLQT